jgi:hypothetical protein
MKGSPAESERVLDALAQTPQRMASMTETIEVSRLQVNADREYWAVNDILRHLRACSDIWVRVLWR